MNRSLETQGTSLPALFHYDAACRALAEAVRVDEVKDILDVAVALRAYAKQAKDRDNEANAIELRLRATRRLAEMIAAQKETIGLSAGTRGSRIKGARVDDKPTLAEAGIDKNLAHQARVLGVLSKEKFEKVVADVRDKAARAVRNAVREIEIGQEREFYRARTKEGGTVADLEALIASGFRAGAICPDFPWEFEVYSGKGKQRSAERYYDTWPLERIKAFACDFIPRLAAPDCVLLMWAIWPEHPGALEVIRACGFEYKGLGFMWLKSTPNTEVITVKRAGLKGGGLHWGTGYATRANTEPCLLAKRGEPLRLSMDVHSTVIAPVGEHSEKPDEVYRRIERLYPGPYLELFARKPREGWTTWGNEIAAPHPLDKGAAVS